MTELNLGNRDLEIREKTGLNTNEQDWVFLETSQ